MFFGHDPAFVQSSEFFPPFTAQPHCIAAMPKNYLIVVMHCISCSDCISNRLCCCGKPSIGLILKQQPHLSPGALQLCTTSSTAHCDHAHAVHTALRESAKSCRKLCGKLQDIFYCSSEGCGKLRKLAESRGKSRKFAKFAESRGKSRESRGNWWKAVAQQLALRDAHGSLHRHTLLLHKWFLIFVEGCAVLGLGKFASSSVTRLPPGDVTALELRQTNNAERHGLVASGHIGCHVAVHILHKQECDKICEFLRKPPLLKPPCLGS